MNGPNEKQLTTDIITYLNYNGCWVWRQNAGTIRQQDAKGRIRAIVVGKRGISDIIGIHKKTGRFIAIEVKIPKRKNTVTVYQWQFLNDVEKWGGIAGVATTPEEALEVINFNTK